MGCLKCGRKTEGDQVFCDLCQTAMEYYPVRPGTAVHLPRRRTAVAPAKQAKRKRPLSHEEQLAGLRKSLRRTRICAAVLALLLCLTAATLTYVFLSADEPLIGQNYTIDTTLGDD